MEKKRSKRKAGRPRTGKRPVLALRVHEDLYEEIRGSAARLKLSISEEAARRVSMSFEWEKQLGDMQSALAEHREVLKGDFEAALRTKGYTPIPTMDGKHMWAEPGFNFGQVNLAIDVRAIVKEMEPGLMDLLARALGKFAKEQEPQP